MLDHLPTAVSVEFKRDGRVIRHGFARRCNAEERISAHEVLSNPGLQVYHSIEEIGGVEYDFVATLRPRTKS